MGFPGNPLGVAGLPAWRPGYGARCREGHGLLVLAGGVQVGFGYRTTVGY